MFLTIPMKCVTTASFRSEAQSAKENEIFSWETEYAKKDIVLHKLFLIGFIIKRFIIK